MCCMYICRQKPVKNRLIWYKQLVVYACFLFLCGPTLAEIRIDILTDGLTSQWDHRAFVGETLYKTETLAGKTCLRAEANGTASGLFREIDVDLTKTPYLNWQWYIENSLGPADETSKAGDDYPARIYVVVSGGLFFWRTRALNYVWASNQAQFSAWPNAFTSNAVMFALQSGPELAKSWVAERRNVLADIKTHLKLDTTEINAIAIMTDTDNSDQSAIACYRNIYFSEQ